MYLSDSAIGFGFATISDDGTVLDTWYPVASLKGAVAVSGTMVLSRADSIEKLGDWAQTHPERDDRRCVSIKPVRTEIASLSDAPVDIHDVYLRLHLLSQRLIRPRQANLDGFLDLLADVAWTSIGACKPSHAPTLLRKGRNNASGIEVRGIFKVPRMLEYVVPDGVWIADANRVLLGAYLAAGTVVTPEGFCGINAGTLGPCMVEGRISLGAIVESGSDIGGGASIMGTTSGGGKHRVSIGSGCLLGANSGLGISLGDRCIVEAGLYLTAGTRVRIPSGETVKATTIGTTPDLVFRRNSETGQVEAIERTGEWGGLNESLHRFST